jgi:hypothetical protein
MIVKTKFMPRREDLHRTMEFIDAKGWMIDSIEHEDGESVINARIHIAADMETQRKERLIIAERELMTARESFRLTGKEEAAALCEKLYAQVICMRAKP